jgi:hypothetical protein
MKIFEIIELLNNQLKGIPCNFDLLIELLNEYLVDQDYNDEQIEAVVKFIISNPVMLTNIFQDLVSHLCRKYTICSIMYNNKILCYYE